MRWIAPSAPPSPHFSWAEVIHNSGYERVPYGPTRIDGLRFVRTPRMNARKHAANLENVRGRVNRVRAEHHLPSTGIRILSWARSYEHNRSPQVRGARDSQHLYFLATDIALEEIDRLCPWPTGHAVFDFVLDTVFRNGGVGLYPAGNRHCDSRGYRARWTSF